MTIATMAEQAFSMGLWGMLMGALWWLQERRQDKRLEQAQRPAQPPVPSSTVDDAGWAYCPGDPGGNHPPLRLLEGRTEAPRRPR